MSNYTTQTASLKSTTIDTRKIDAKQIDTKKLFINGELFDPSKESPNDAMFRLIISPVEDRDYVGVWMMESLKEEQYDFSTTLQNGSQTNGVIPNGVYVGIQIDDSFAKCIGGNSLNDTDSTWLYNILLAKFGIQFFTNTGSVRIEQCILENFLTSINNSLCWVIKICEEDDNLSELYGGVTDENPNFAFLISIPYYIPENDTSSSTYSLRKTNPIDSLHEKFEQMRQQILDNSAE